MTKSLLKYGIGIAAGALFIASTTGVRAIGLDSPRKPVVSASVTPDSVMIGDRFVLEITVDKDLMQAVAFPTFNTGEIEGTDEEGERRSVPSFECITELPEDTLSRDGRRMKIRKRYTLAAFDEGAYTLSPVQVLYADKNIVDTLAAPEHLVVAVATFELDSTAMAKGICDIKPQKTLKLRFGEFSGWLALALALLLVAAAAVYGLKKWLNSRGKRLSDLFKPTPPPPPHIAAISALEELHNRKLWQNNRHKEYYSALSDILRTYLDGRYGVGAMEMTTDEIMDAVKGVEMPSKCSMNLVAVLRDADLVKFAKATPDAEENEENYNRAYFFVEETKPAQEQTDSEGATIVDGNTPMANAEKGGGR